MSDGKKKRGPDPERLKIEGDCEKAVDKALKRQKPAEGWPTGKEPVEPPAESDEEDGDHDRPQPRD